MKQPKPKHNPHYIESGEVLADMYVFFDQLAKASRGDLSQMELTALVKGIPKQSAGVKKLLRMRGEFLGSLTDVSALRVAVRNSTGANKLIIEAAKAHLEAPTEETRAALFTLVTQPIKRIK